MIITRAMKQKERGLLIALEGIDGVGKTTLARHLAQKLEQLTLPVILTKEPGATPLGAQLRTTLAERSFPLDSVAEFLLFSADRAQHIKDVVKPALERGITVISDRMSDSSRAYQGFGRGLDMVMIEQVTKWVMQDIKPDITLYIALDPSVAWERIQARGHKVTAFEQEQRLFFEKVIAGFETIFAHRDDVLYLDGQLSPEELSTQAFQTLKNLVQNTTMYMR
jgi:dTMP kinase